MTAPNRPRGAGDVADSPASRSQAPAPAGQYPATDPNRPEQGQTRRKKRRPKDIGTDAERPVARHLAANGFPHAERRALRGTKDAGDITGIPGVCIEVKGGEQAKAASDNLVDAWLAETETERRNGRADVGLLVLQRRGVGPANAGRWWAAMPLWTLLWLQSQADRDVTGCPTYTGSADLFEIGASDPSTPWMYAPVRMLLADAAQLLRAAGYGDPLTTELPEGLPNG